MIRTGIDMIRLSRINLLCQEDRFLDRVCTKQEQKYLESHKRRQQKIAAMFSLKEAFSKAMGTGIGADLGFLDLEVSYEASGRPTISYIGKQWEQKSLSWNVSCSVSHEDDYLVSIVVIEGF